LIRPRLAGFEVTGDIASPLPFAADSNITWRMLAKVCSAAVNGIEAYPVEVEVNAGYGDTIIVIVEAI